MKTLVVGAAIIDILMKIDRLPKSGEDILCSESKTAVGGCAYNVANTLKNLDCPVDLCVPVGRGPYADIITRALEKSGYDILIRDESQDNGYCLALVEASGERTFITVQGSEGSFKEEWLDSLDMSQYDRIYVAGYEVYGACGMVISKWLSTLSGKQIFFAPGPVICDLDSQVMETIFSVHPVVHLNEKEALDYTGKENIQQAVQVLYDLAGNLVIVTLGENGTLYYDGKEIHTVPPVKTSVVDTIGAGDSHIGAIMGGLSKGYSIEKCCSLANYVASCVVSVQGPTINKELFEEMMERYYEKD